MYKLSNITLIVAASIAGGAMLALSGCANNGPYRPAPAYAPSSYVYVKTAPPAPRRVVMPPRPSDYAIWIDGYWNWSGYDYVWISGFWEANPPRNQTWVRDRWANSNQGWYREQGRWSGQKQPTHKPKKSPGSRRR